MKRKNDLNHILLSISNEIARIKDKEDMLQLIRHTLKQYLRFNDSQILKFNKTNRTCKPYIYHTNKELAQHPQLRNYLDLEYAVADDSIDHFLDPIVYNIASLMPAGSEQIHFMHSVGVKEFAVVKLIEGRELIGLLVLLSEKENSFSKEDLDLLHKISFQVAIATAYLIANDEIVKQEGEKNTLLSLTSKIATVRNKNELLELLSAELINLFAIKGFGITLINADAATHSPFVVDIQNELKIGDEFEKAVSQMYSVTDGVFDVIINADGPVTLNVNELLQRAKPPAYVQLWEKMSVKEVVGIPVRAGSSNLGCFILLPDDPSSATINGTLFKGVGAQISVAISHILANEEIAKKEEEKTILLSLSNEISSLKNRTDLFKVVNERIKKLFSINEFAVAKIDEDRKTYSAFMLDLEDRITTDADFEGITSDHYSINDALFSMVMNSEDPIVFQVNDIVHNSEMPAFVHFWKKVGLQRVLCAALRTGGKLIGMAVLHVDNNSSINPVSILLKGICAQLSVAISNILANEEIERREIERERLLSFNLDIAAVRSYNELLTVINRKLKKLLGFSHTLLVTVNKDKTTTSVFLVDPELKGKNYPDDLNEHTYPLEDGILPGVLSSSGPFIYHLKELQKNGKGEMPVYFKVNWEKGMEQAALVRFSTGDLVLGAWVIIYATKILLNKSTLSLIEGLANQLSITISNIIAYDDIKDRELEKTKLLAFSNEMASSRDKRTLGKILTHQLIEVLGVKGYYMLYALSKNKKTYYPLLFDPDSSPSNLSPDPGFERMIKSDNLVSESIMERILEQDEPLFFKIEERFKKPMSPAYAKMMAERGITKIAGATIKLGDEKIGVILFDTKNKPLGSRAPLFKSICSQIAISVSNIIADEEIKGREKEKTMLLDFSNAIASVRDKNVLAKILKQQLVDLFAINDYVIYEISEDKKTLRPILFDAHAGLAKPPDSIKLDDHQGDAVEGTFRTILHSDNPVSFDIEDWDNSSTFPFHSQTLNKGLTKYAGIRIRMGNENIAVIYFSQDVSYQPVLEDPLFKSICSQLAITVANIITNEKVSDQLFEINKYKQQLEEEKIYLKEEIATTQNFSELIGESEAMKRVFRLVQQVSSTDSTVLILGETGTGKELIARAIHNGSPRKNKLMIKVNCAAIPPSLIESELFGHERGSFTGANERRIGKFELAHQGTLFLDEIGEMPLEMQVKLLRALQEKEIERVGGRVTIKVDARIIAATNRNLEQLMDEGKFRSDLYYRLNIFPIDLPPLRNRKEDIPFLALHFVKRFAKKTGKEVNSFSHKAIEELTQYYWPGNIRELEHLIERAVLLSKSEIIKEIQLPSSVKNPHGTKNVDEVPIKTIDENERDYILKVLKHVKGRISGEGGAAALLRIPPSTLHSRMKRLGIRKEHFA